MPAPADAVPRPPRVRAEPLIARFADRLLATDLPELPAARRGEAVCFVVRRVEKLPSVTRAGVLALGAAYRALLVLPGGARLTRALADHPLPLVGDYPRLIRSLAYAYVWERWPATGASGAP